MIAFASYVEDVQDFSQETFSQWMKVRLHLNHPLRWLTRANLLDSCRDLEVS